jgi:hypothetical protein
LKVAVFWDVNLCNFVDKYLSFGGTGFIHLQASSVLKMESGFTKMLVPIYQTAWHHITEDNNVHSQQCENESP